MKIEAIPKQGEEFVELSEIKARECFRLASESFGEAVQGSHFYQKLSHKGADLDDNVYYDFKYATIRKFRQDVKVVRHNAILQVQANI